MATRTYIVVEQAGCEGENDRRRFTSYDAAIAWRDDHYSEAEETDLHVDIACENEAGDRTYDFY